MAERIAYTWDNKHKDHLSGAYDTKDQLYWYLSTLSTKQTETTFTPHGTVEEINSRLSTFSAQATPHYHFFHQGSLTQQSRLLPKIEVLLTYQLPFNHYDSELSRSSSIYLIHPSGYLYDYKFLDYLIKNTVSEEQQQKLKEVFHTQ